MLSKIVRSSIIEPQSKISSSIDVTTRLGSFFPRTFHKKIDHLMSTPQFAASGKRTAGADGQATGRRYQDCIAVQLGACVLKRLYSMPREVHQETILTAKITDNKAGEPILL